MIEKESLTRFVINEKLGEGVTAMVMSALDMKQEKKIAIKLFTKEEIDSAKDEIAIVNKIKESKFLTPYLPSYFNCFQFDNGMFGITMEHVQGKKFPCALIHNPKKIIYSFYSALEFLHKHEIAHRDINIGNDIVRPDNTCCLIDYNWAIQKNDCEEVAITSINYISPEILFCTSNNIWNATVKNDVWAAAVLIITQIAKIKFPWMLGNRNEVEQYLLSMYEKPLIVAFNMLNASNSEYKTLLGVLLIKAMAVLSVRASASEIRHHFDLE